MSKLVQKAEGWIWKNVLVEMETGVIIMKMSVRNQLNITLDDVFCCLCSCTQYLVRHHGQVVREARLWCRKLPQSMSSRLGFAMLRLENSLSAQQ